MAEVLKFYMDGSKFDWRKQYQQNPLFISTLIRTFKTEIWINLLYKTNNLHKQTNTYTYQSGSW